MGKGNEANSETMTNLIMGMIRKEGSRQPTLDVHPGPTKVCLANRRAGDRASEKTTTPWNGGIS